MINHEWPRTHAKENADEEGALRAEAGGPLTSYLPSDRAASLPSHVCGFVKI
jgi:hypothetical protein